MVTTDKAQDLLAVVKAATNRRTTRDGIDIIDAVLIDDSKAETGELATVFVSVWGDQKVDLIEKNVGKPLAFFNLTIKIEAATPPTTDRSTARHDVLPNKSDFSPQIEQQIEAFQAKLERRDPTAVQRHH